MFNRKSFLKGGLGRGALVGVCLATSAGLSACSHAPIVITESSSPCRGIDWWESGRTDGVAGGALEHLNQEKQRCDGTADPVQVDVYMNGREAGLVDYCTPAQGYAAGRNGAEYRKVCPTNLDIAFVKNFETGRRVRLLEQQHSELENKISLLTKTLSPAAGRAPSSTNPSLQAELEELRLQRAQVDFELSRLENRDRQL